MTRYTAAEYAGTVDCVHLDGQRLEDVVEADDELGFAIVIDTNTLRATLLTGKVAVTLYPSKSH